MNSHTDFRKDGKGTDNGQERVIPSEETLGTRHKNLDRNERRSA